jgi:4-hydroxybenzoyl-CoA thioesterase
VVVFERPIRFQEVDAARIVFFGRYLDYAHEAMEDFFSALDGGYVALINGRRIGFPAVTVTMKFSRPSRFGDTLSIETSTARLGRRSAVLRYVMRDKASREIVCEVEHTVVVTDLEKMRSVDMPADVRERFEAHLAI